VCQDDDGALGLGVRRPGARRVATTLTSSSVEAGDVRGERLALDGEAVLAQLALDRVGGVALPSVPGERSGSSCQVGANWSAVALSKKGCARGGVSASGLPTLKAATSTGTATTSQAAR
jgi:hypothetical protein